MMCGPLHKSTTQESIKTYFIKRGPCQSPPPTLIFRVNLGVSLEKTTNSIPIFDCSVPEAAFVGKEGQT